MRVVGEGLHDVGSGVDEVAMQLGDRFRMLEHHLGHEGAGLQVAAPFQFEQVAFGADDRPGVETLQ